MFPLSEIHLTAKVIRFTEEKHIISVEVCPVPLLLSSTPYLSEVYITLETCVSIFAWKYSFCMKKLVPVEEPVMFCQRYLAEGFANLRLQLALVQLRLTALLKYFCLLGGQKGDEKLVEWLIKGKEVL